MGALLEVAFRHLNELRPRRRPPWPRQPIGAVPACDRILRSLRQTRPVHEDRGPARRAATARTALAVLAVLALVLAACSSANAGTGGRPPGGGSGSAASGTPVVSPRSARSIVASTMATNNRANARLDTSLLASYEAGSAFRLDNATYQADRAAHFVPPASPFSVRLKQLAVARQTTWPAVFVAEGSQHSLSKGAPASPQTCGTILAFERTSGQGRWRIVLEPSLRASRLPALAMSSKGSSSYAPRLSAARQRSADGLPAKFVRALLREETSGQLGPFKRSDFTDPCGGMPNPRADVLGAEAAGFGQRDLFRTASRPDTTAVALRGGGTLVMFTLRFEDQLLAPQASHLIAWAHPDLSKSPGEAWTYFLPTGTYASVNEQGELEVAVELSPSGSSWTFLGSYAGVTAVTGHRATSSQSPPSTSQLAAFGS